MWPRALLRICRVAERTPKIELIGETKVAQIDLDIGEAHSTIFISRLAPDALLFADNRSDLAEVLARTANHGDHRAFDDDLPEWKHVDLGARQWAIRHYKDANSSFAGIAYSVQAGDVANLVVLSRNEKGLELANRIFGASALKLREGNPNLIEVTYSVRTKQDLSDFFSRLFASLWIADLESGMRKRP